MPVNTIEEACEVLNRVRHRGRDDWHVEDIAYAVSHKAPHVEYPLDDAIIIACYYELLEAAQPFIDIAANPNPPLDLVLAADISMEQWRALAAFKDLEGE